MRGIRKWAFWGIGVFVFGIILILVGVLIAPRFVSTQWFRLQIEDRASTALDRPVHIRTLDWRWTDGLRICGLRVDDDPSFSENPLLFIDDTFLKLDLKALLERRIAFSFQMTGVQTHLVRQQDGRSNVEALLSDLRQPAVQPDKKDTTGGLPFVVPEDVTATIEIKDLTMQIDDRLYGRHLRIHDAEVKLTAPSLQHQPAHLRVTSKQQMNQTPLPPLRLAIRISDFMTPSWGLTLDTLSLNAEAMLPGLDLSLEGYLGRKQIDAKLGLDLKLLSDAVRPFAPPSLPETAGRIDMTLKGSKKAHEAIRFHLHMTGKDLKAEGGALKEIRMLPMTFRMTQEGLLYPHDKMVKITNGEFRLEENTRIAWEGVLKQPESGPVAADLIVGPLRIDLREITQTLKGIIPQGISLAAPHDGDQNKTSQVKIDRVRIKGEWPGEKRTIELKGLELCLAGISADIPETAFTAQDLCFCAKSGDVVFSGGFPTHLNIDSSLAVKDVHLKGPTELKIQAVELDALRLKSTRMAPDKAGLVGITGHIVLKTRGTLKTLSAPVWGGVRSISHAFDGILILPPSPVATLKQARFSVALKPPVDIRSIHATLNQDVDIIIQLDQGRLQKRDSIKIDAKNIKTIVDAGRLCKAHVNAGFQDLGAERLTTTGTLRLDAAKIRTLIPSNIRPKGDLSGDFTLNWTFKGRRPRPAEIRHIIQRQQPLDIRVRHMRFIQDMEILARLDNLALDVPLSRDNRLTAGGIHTPSPLVLKVKEGFQEFDLKGDITCDHLRSTPGLGRLDPAIRLGLGFSLKTENLKTAEISQSLDIHPLQIRQTFTGTIDHLDRLLGKTSDLAVGRILSTLDAAMATQLKVDLARLSSTIGLSAAGVVSAGADLALTGNQDLTTHLRLKSSISDLNMDKITVDHLQTDLKLFRRFNIASSHPSEPADSTAPPLSRTVLHPRTSPGFRGSRQRRFDRIPTLPLRPPDITLASAVIPAGPFALNVSNSRVNVDLKARLPKVDHFQADILGGTITGSLRIIEQPEWFMLKMDCAFSGVDMRRLSHAPPAAPLSTQGLEARDTEISGQIICQLPISQNPITLLDHLRLRIHLTHIGSKTLERFLYALDPYESNEMIVKQRSLLRHGRPRWVMIDIQDGNLSLKGEVAVKGARISLPEINRFNVSRLPVSDRLNKQAPRLKRIIQMLKILGSTTILINEQNGFQLIGKDTP